MPDATPPDSYLADTHVHLHPGGDPARVLSGAARHMTRAARAFGWPARPPGILMLTETAGLDQFAALAGSHGDWEIGPTGEAVSLLARPADGTAPIAIVSGRQIVTEEGLEAHALGTRRTFADGRPIREILAEIPADGAQAVLPWGVGKWSGRRGQIIAALIAEGAHGLVLADSGVRPRMLPRPALLAQAEARGLRVIAGSDPLPLAVEAEKAGRFGIVARHAFDPERPFAAFRAWLQGLAASPETYGALEGLTGFLRAQVAMQLAKRLKR